MYSKFNSPPAILVNILGIFTLPISSCDTLWVQLSHISILSPGFKSFSLFAPSKKSPSSPFCLANNIEKLVKFISLGTILSTSLKACESVITKSIFLISFNASSSSVSLTT